MTLCWCPKEGCEDTSPKIRLNKLKIAVVWLENELPRPWNFTSASRFVIRIPMKGFSQEVTPFFHGAILKSLRKF